MALFLVRHASAGHRNGADPADTERRLDPEGIDQAATVAKHLSGERVELVLSSPFPRCIETVQPLADRLGVEVVLEAALAEGADIKDSWRLMEALHDTRAVMCSHGDVIPELVSRNQRRGMQVPGKSGCAKASVWKLSGWDGDHFTKGVYTKLRD